MKVITISRQLGSLGEEVAELVAANLGYRLVGRDLVNEAARRSGAPAAALAAIDDLGLLGAEPSETEVEAYRASVQQVMDELAADGRVVILGRAGQVCLSCLPDALHVRVIASRDIRAQRVAARKNVSLKGALAQTRASDRFRENYIRRFYQVDWDDPLYYHLVINTDAISAQVAAALIETAAHGLHEASQANL